MVDLLPTREELEELIMNTIDMVWLNHLRKSDIDRWLFHFDGSILGDINHEHQIALLLLNHFVFYNLEEVRYLCNITFKKYVHYMLENTINDNKDLNQSSIELIQKTIFVSIGNPSESSSNLLYYYRQENRLPISRFYFDNEINLDSVDNIVLIDDVSLSGSQLVTYIRKSTEKYKDKKVFFTPLISTVKADSFIKNELNSESNNITVLPGILLDEREQFFSEKSYIFADNYEMMELVKKFVKCYSSKYNFLLDPFGFKEGQLALGFFYNIPNNTLPIFWYNSKDYSGIFKRYSKISSDKYKGVNHHEQNKFI